MRSIAVLYGAESGSIAFDADLSGYGIGYKTEFMSSMVQFVDCIAVGDPVSSVNNRRS